MNTDMYMHITIFVIIYIHGNEKDTAIKIFNGDDNGKNIDQCYQQATGLDA